MKIKSLINSKIYRIRGFLHPVDAMMFYGIIESQSKAGWRGAVAEIGVFYGRSLALMSAIASQYGDKTIGFDLFDIDGQQAYVQKVLTKIGTASKTNLISGSSLDIDDQFILNQIGPVRFFSIDGGHEIAHIRKDSKTALNALSENGVIAFDDFMNSEYPDLSAGIIDFMRENSDKVKPFAITKSKLYACRAPFYKHYFDLTGNLQFWAGSYTSNFDAFDTPVVYIGQSLVDRGIYQKLSEHGVGFFGEMLTSVKRRKFSR